MPCQIARNRQAATTLVRLTRRACTGWYNILSDRQPRLQHRIDKHVKHSKRDDRHSSRGQRNAQRSRADGRLTRVTTVHKVRNQPCAGVRNVHSYWDIRVTALVPSMTACLASSPPRSSRTPVWISLEVRVFLPAESTDEFHVVHGYSAP